jgi:DNA replication licensing factor MCM7
MVNLISNLSFNCRSVTKELSVREVRGEHLGHLVKIKGMVTRVSNVKPFCVVAAYSCDQCGNEVFQEITSQTWMPLDQCPSVQCKTNSIKGKLHMQTRGCKFLRFQEVKIQELV